MRPAETHTQREHLSRPQGLGNASLTQDLSINQTFRKILCPRACCIYSRPHDALDECFNMNTKRLKITQQVVTDVTDLFQGSVLPCKGAQGAPAPLVLAALTLQY